MTVVSLKVTFQDTTKRRMFDSAGSDSYERLVQVIASSYPELQNRVVTVKFLDDEDELCTISSALELQEAVTVTQSLERSYLKLFLSSAGLQSQKPPEAKKPIETRKPVPIEPIAKPVPSKLIAKPVPIKPVAKPLQVKAKNPKVKKSESEQMKDVPKDVFVTLLLDFVMDEKIVAAIPQTLELIAQKLPEVKDEASAHKLIDTVLNSCPAISNHEVVQMALRRRRACLVQKLMKMAPHSDMVTQALPQLLLVLPKLLETAPAVLSDVLEAMESQPEGKGGFCGPRFMAPLFQHLIPLLRPIMFSSLGKCGMGGMPGFMDSCAPVLNQTPLNAVPAAPGAHQGIHCDGCKQYPIQGTRFKCAVCHDYDLCASCEEKGIHPASHPLIKMRVPDRKDIHHSVACDGCGANPISGPRFKCTVCPNFDLCSKCEAKDAHPQDHPLIKMRVAGPRGHGFGHGRRGGFFGHGNHGHHGHVRHGHRGRQGHGFGGHCGKQQGGRGFGGHGGGRGMWRRAMRDMMRAFAQQQQQCQPTPSAHSVPSQSTPSDPQAQSAGEQVALVCPAKHELKRFVTNRPGFYCDKCTVRQKLPKGTIMYGCRQCDWDVCQPCFEGKKAAADAHQDPQQEPQQEDEAKAQADEAPTPADKAPLMVEVAPDAPKAQVITEEEKAEEEAPFASLVEASPYDVQLQVLNSMGFLDRELNLAALQRLKGSLPRTIDHLINQ